ncbi:MAG: SDR family oxidoreductase [Gemmataceae bacterium]
MQPVKRHLEGKRCLLVGGTGGLGLAAARRFLEEGARVALAGNDREAGARAVEALAASGGPTFLPCDATCTEQVEALFADAVASLGGLDVLYHLAGGNGRRFGDGPLHECTDDGWDITQALHLRSVFLTNRAAVRHFLARSTSGVILNMASVLSASPSPHHFDTCAYAAAKGGMISLTRQTAARYAGQGIRINVLAPGVIDTPLTRRTFSDPAIQTFMQGKQPLRGGPGRLEDCADAAVFLCSDAARFITGAVLTVDGGWCLNDGQYT